MRTTVWTRVCLLLMAIALLSGCAATPPGETTQNTEDPTTESTPSTEEVIVADGNIYYNVDKGTDRTAGVMGMYSLVLAGSGASRGYLLQDEALAKKADTMLLFGLGFNKGNIAQQVYSLEEMGYSVAYEKLTVASVSETKAVCKDPSGAEVKLSVGIATKVFHIRDGETTLQADDTILAVQNADKRITTIFVTDREPIKHLCDHCKETVVWTPWSDSGNLPISGTGHYVLTTDVTVGSQASMLSGAEIILDLNGHTIKNAGGVRCISLHNSTCYLAVMDYSEAQTGKIVAATDAVDQGGCVWARYGTFELFSGTLDASGAATLKCGPAVDVVPSSTFNMYGGTVIGGKSNINPSNNNGYGGTVNVRGTFNMYGGTIQGGTSQREGGNVYVAPNATFNMAGGTITGGTANTATEAISGTVEANVFAREGGVFQKTGGTIEGE